MFPVLFNRASREFTPATLADTLFGPAFGQAFSQPEVALPTRIAPLTVKETNGGYEAQVELPGFTKDAIEVDIDGEFVTVRAKAEAAKEKKDGERVVYAERQWGSVQRRFRLPVAVSLEHSSASFDNGVLTLSLRQSAQAGPKRLTLQ